MARPTAKDLRIATALKYIASAADEGIYPESGVMAANELMQLAGLNPKVYLLGEVARAIESCGIPRNRRSEFRVRAITEFAPALRAKSEALLGHRPKVSVVAK